LLVTATSDTEDVTFVFITKRGNIYFLGDTFIKEDVVFLFIFNIDNFTSTGSGIRNVQLKKKL